MRVRVHYSQQNRGPVEPLLRARNEIVGMGVDLKLEDGSPPDPKFGGVVVAQQTSLSPQLLDQMTESCKVILQERVDSAILWTRQLIQHPRVKKVFKIAIIKDHEKNNETRGRFHSIVIDPSQKQPPSIMLSPEALRKGVAQPSYFAYDILQSLYDREIDFDAVRPYVIHFAGTVRYDREDITKHRQQAVAAIAKCPGNHVCNDGKPMGRVEYWDTLQKSMVCVSPWGYGEMCYRDYEALLLGAVLVKPDTSWVQTYPDILIPNVTYLTCRHDFADLPDVVSKLQDEWKSWRDRRYAVRELLKRHNTPASLASWYVEKFRELQHEGRRG